jgi:hypothetical protein
VNDFLNLITQGAGSSIQGISSAIVTMLFAIVFGLVIGITYMATSKRQYAQNFVVTVVMLPSILSMIIFLVGSNLAMAFSLAGTLSIIRFRSAPGDPKDIGYIFAAIAAGLASGVGLYVYGILFVAVFSLLMVLLFFSKFAKPKSNRKILKITVPENLDFNTAFDELLERFTARHEMVRVKTTNLGSLFELSYDITLLKNCNEKAFLDELRCLNGNLTISLSAPISEQQY